ncbi:uncharacterized protein LOC107786215 [Nicotiana tabacum]|uniref:Uncharacterized protein LOC107786215 n=1 Tax=Nicotiana tabacum TaxID=4097 RepID=A0AC58STH2_TOBAC
MFAKKLFQKATQYHHNQHQQRNGSGLTAIDLNVRATVHYGIPSTASILAVDPIQRLLAIGTLDGRVKVIGGDNIEGLLISPKQLPYKYLEFLQNQGFLVSITNENDIQVWNLKSRSVACDLQWKSNITAFSVINGSSFLYVGDEYGTISVLKFCVENRELLQLPYQILWSSLSEAAGFANADHQPVVGILPQPFTSGNRLLIAYESGLIILWDVVEAHVIIVKGDKDLHLKDGAVNFKKNADSSSPDDLLQHEFEEKEITTLCWASTDGSILAVGYIDGDILFWKTSKSTLSKGQEAGPFDNVVKLQLSSAEKRLPVIVLNWWANSKSRNSSDGHLLIYGGDEIGSDEVITILTLDWSSGMETLKCVGRVDLTFSGSFADTILLPTTGTAATDEKAALFVLMSPGQLKLLDCSSLSDLVSKELKKVSLSAEDFPVELPTVDPSMTVTKLTQLHSDGNLPELLQETPLFKKFCTATSSGANGWPLTGGVYNHISQAETNRIQRVYIAGYQDGSVRMWDATHPVFFLLCVLDNEVKGVNTVISTASVSKIDFCFQTLRLAVGDECGLVRLYDFKHSDMENFHFITDAKSEVHELAQGQGPSCRAVIKLLDVRVRAIEFINHGAKLAVGYENVKVAVLDMTSLSVLFLTDSVSVGSSPLVSVIAKRFMHSDGHSKSPKQSELPENHMEELMFVLTEDAKIYVIDGGSGKTSSLEPLHLKKVSTAISMYVIENNTPFSGIISKKPQSSKDDANSNEPSQDMTTSDQCDTAPFLQNDPSRKHFEESFVLLCCKDAIRTYATKSVVHGNNKSVCKVKLDKPCCWTTTFMKDGKVCGLLLLFQNGDIEIRSLPDLELVEQTSLMSVLRWNFKLNMDRAMSSMENGHVTLANGSELAFVSLLASENDFRIPESLPFLHDEVLAAAADAAIKFSTQKKKQGSGPNIIGTLVKGFKVGKTNHNMDLSEMSKSNFSHLEGIFMKNPLNPEPSPIITKEVQGAVELDIDDIEIDDPVPVAPTSSHSTQNSKRGTERGKLLDSEGDDVKPRLRTREEIIAKYRKAGDASSAAGEARNKLLERQEKLERISQRTDELRSGAEDFASLANELVKVMENRNRKWWQI